MSTSVARTVDERTDRLVYIDAHAPTAPDSGQSPERPLEATPNGGMIEFRCCDPDPRSSSTMAPVPSTPGENTVDVAGDFEPGPSRHESDRFERLDIGDEIDRIGRLETEP